MRMTQKEYYQRHRKRLAGEIIPDARKAKRPHPHTGAEITADLVRALLDYNESTGELTWKNRGQPNWDGRMAGKTAGRKRRGYIDFELNGKRCLAHRVIWLWVTGKWPQELIDHVDGNGLNNRWANLRQATTQQNAWNKRALGSLPKGVTACGSRYLAQIKADGKSRYLGSFSTPEEAHAAYMRAAKESFGEFARAA